MGSRPSPIKGKIRVFPLQEVSFAIVVRSVGVTKYGHYTAQAQAQAQAQESLLNFGPIMKIII